MRRPTIRDLASAAGVSASTVNRILAGHGKVREGTMARVQLAAETIGFYGVGAIQSRVVAARPKYRFGILLNQASRVWYQSVAQAFRSRAAHSKHAELDVQIEFLDDLSPQNIASRMTALGEICDAIAVVAAVHPLVTHAVSDLQARGKPVFALISQLSATGQVHYIGLDNWKVGRTAAWAFAHICKSPGKLGILVGNHRYRCQEMNEAGFRSYFREFAPDFTLLGPLSTFETSAVAQEMTEKLLKEHPDLAGLYVAGGGISGALAGLRTMNRAGSLVAIGYELMASTRTALADGTLAFVISHPITRLANETLHAMTRAVETPTKDATYTCILPFEIYTRENI